jgi:hypothetical protein
LLLCTAVDRVCTKTSPICTVPKYRQGGMLLLAGLRKGQILNPLADGLSHHCMDLTCLFRDSSERSEGGNQPSGPFAQVPIPAGAGRHKNCLTNSSATVGAINWLVAHYAVMGINFTHALNQDLGEGLLSWYQALVMHDTPLQIPHSRNRQLQSMCKLACSCSRSSTCHIATHLSSWSIQVLPNSLPKSPQRAPEVHMMD